MGSTAKNIQKKIMNMQEFIFATNNANKVAEIKSVLNNRISVISLQEAGINQEIAEPWETFRDNAKEKVTVINQLTGQNCFSEDSGLEVEALHGTPGVQSARYAGDHATASDNISKLLAAMQGIENRTAQFKTVIALFQDETIYYFEGICKGQILKIPIGNSGFGYDPVFTPDGAAGKSFAEMTMEEKNKYSHRKKAVELLAKHLIQ